MYEIFPAKENKQTNTCKNREVQSFLTLFVEEKSGNIKTFKAFLGEKMSCWIKTREK